MSSKLDNQRRRILIVDDDPNTLRMVSKALEWEGYQVEVAKNGQLALEKISQWSPHLILLDMNMPGINGMETLRHLHSRMDHYVAVIFVSGQSQSEDVISGLDAGADDYICKPFDVKELLARVRSQLRIKDLNDELMRANAKLQELVDIDDLTGLFNMRSLYNKLDNELDRGRRYGRSVCVLMMDMDHFKSVNDNHDHLFGSFVLSEVGRIIQQNIRNVDFAARYGGDEFLIVLTEIEPQGAKAFAERLRSKIDSHEFKSDMHSKSLSSSVGYAITEKGNSTLNARSLVRWADKALYDAKEGGRNCVRSYDFSDESIKPDDDGTNPEVLRKS